MVDFLTGADRADARLAGAVRDLVPPAVDALAPAQARLLEALAAMPGARIVFTGGDPRSRRGEAAAIGAQLRMPVLLASAPAAAEPHGAHVVALAFREATLRSALLLWEDCEALFDRGRPLPAWGTLLQAAARHRWPTMLDHAALWDPEDRAESTPLVRWPLPRLGCRRTPGPVGSRARRTAPTRDAVAQRLAQTFDLTAAQIQDAAAMAAGPRVARRRRRRRDRGPPARGVPPPDRTAAADLHPARRGPGRPRPRRRDRAARRAEAAVARPGRPDPAAERARRTSLRRTPGAAPSGVVCLFTGSSGTGKTLAAACVASALGKDLLRVDLPAVVSKWVGETEKNLQQVFAEAEDANAVMFFDEAEAFFAKRGEVKGAQDRWAMMETDYLLQRIEGYTGAVILATNLRQQIDEAFLRRIHVVIEFPFPDKDQRAELWIRALHRRLPDQTRQQIIDEFSVHAARRKDTACPARLSTA